jgi:hypothetical protein
MESKIVMNCEGLRKMEEKKEEREGVQNCERRIRSSGKKERI